MQEPVIVEGPAGIVRRDAVEVTADGTGLIGRFPVKTPSYQHACYYAPFQKYAINPKQDLWPEGYNQCQPLAVESLDTVKRGGMLALLQLHSGAYLALLPLATPDTMAFFTSQNETFCVEVAHWGTDGYEGAVNLMAWAEDANPYLACEGAWREALTIPEIAAGLRLRTNKKFPEPFEYLGWCSWEQYKANINESLLVRTLRELDASPVPVRWLLVDDGHLNFTAPSKEGPAQQAEKRLTDFGVDRAKFPQGWAPLKAAQKESEIRWLGVWLNFNGYWGGVSTESDFGNVADTLIALSPGVCLPGGSTDAAAHFYDAFIEAQEAAGFDFVKVDNQAGNVAMYQDHVERAVPHSVANHRGLEKACAKRLRGLINCMAHNNIGIFNTCESAVTRCSEDYLLEDAWRAKMHLFNSFGNMMLFGPTVWGDHDMFHSTDRFAGGVMARSKALSGGPVYLSDIAGEINVDAVAPLCCSDGKLLHPQAPAVPLPDSLFIDPYKADDAFRVIAPLRHGVAAVGLYNLTHPEKPLTGTVSADDYRWAGGMLQDGTPGWTAPEGVVVYDVINHSLQSGRITLETFGDSLFLLCPIQSGWAVIGSPSKYLCSEAIETVTVSESKLKLRLLETGELYVWLDSGTPISDNAVVSPVEPGLWSLTTPSTELVIERR